MPDRLTAEDLPNKFGQYATESTKKRMAMSMHAAQRVKPPLWSRAVHMASLAMCAGYGVYALFYQDFGTEEHCFSALRRWADEKRIAFWSLSEEEEKQLRSRGLLR
ncbi:hypothetical protein BDF19DRAFT_421354 [Syncephalis fuscata]|nr:hypothetical protein BDF19DRAFT_421354 [Syncephalis fuscata]